MALDMLNNSYAYAASHGQHEDEQDNDATYYTTLPNNLPILIDVPIAARIRGNSEAFIRRECCKGNIKATKLGRSWRIHRDAFLKQCGLM